MLGLAKDLAAYFACKSGREHTRVLSALRDFKPMLQAGIAAAGAKSVKAAAAQVAAAPDQSPAKNTRSRAKPAVGPARMALGQRSANNATLGPAGGMAGGMEGLGAAVAARAASRRSALAGLP